MRIAFLLFVFALGACDSAEMEQEVPPPPFVRPPAQYVVTFEAAWSEETHPADFPPNPHFSRLTGAVHSEDVSLWRVGGVASNGVRSMAETGGVSTLMAEVGAVGAQASYVEGDPIRLSPGSGSAMLTVSETQPLATVVTMIAPSPDWFVGVSGLDLREPEGWQDRVEVEAVVYDAGTDDGASYTAPNASRTERAPIAVADYAPLAGAAIGTLVFERVVE